LKIKTSTKNKINERVNELLALHQVVTVSEMAEIMNVSVQYIRKQCKDGKLTCRKSSDGVWLILKTKEETK
jgi:DeoR/GlpR family transcriptional regulator of sugar metabolism